MASQAYQETFIDRGTKEAHILPEEVLDMLIGELRRCILYTNDPLKERILDFHIFCEKKLTNARRKIVTAPNNGRIFAQLCRIFSYT